MKVFVIGGSAYARGTVEFDEQLRTLKACGRQLGADLVGHGHELVLCSPFEDALDYHVAVGAARAAGDDSSTIQLHFYYPDLEPVIDQLRRLQAEVGATQIRRFPSAPLSSDLGATSMQYSWLFAQLNALDSSAGVIAIGGKRSGAAQLLFSLAAARNKSILPLTFLGGAASDYSDSNFWDLSDVLGERIDLLSKPSRVRDAPDLLEALLAGVPTRDAPCAFRAPDGRLKDLVTGTGRSLGADWVDSSGYQT